MATDMRQYVERLAKAWPERFLFSATRDDSWTLDVLGSNGDVAYRPLRGWDRDITFWAFWGPLADEMKIEAISVGTFDGDCHFVGPTDLLESIADAVCQEAERRAELTP